MKNQSFACRVGFAWAGLVAAAKSEASFRTQLVLAALAAVVLVVLRPPWPWIALCLISAAAVLAAELFNTALEHLADRLHPERHPSIQTAKDCAAGAVLLLSLVALLVGTASVAAAIGWI
jgi:undecaprenol kinase